MTRAESDEVSWSPEEIAGSLAARVQHELALRDGPLLVGLDGRSGGGKSTVAAALADALSAVGVAVTLIEGDDFYGGGSSTTWDARTPAEKAQLVIDWSRQRQVLRDLVETGVASWHPFDWDADDWDGEPIPLAEEPVTAEVAPVVVLEGAYSCRPELHDLLHLRVLLDVPTDIRRQQLLQREGDEYRADWERRWSAAEEHYVTAVMPPERFDLVLRPIDGAAVDRT